MKNLWMFLLAAFSVSCFAADRYMDRMFDVSVEKDVVYAENVPVPTSLNMFTKLLSGIMDSPTNLLVLFDNDSEQEKQNMLMNLYTPKGDSETKRPVVIVAHGGAFVAGARDDEDQQTIQFCDSLAARGYVTAALGYRLGVVMQTEGSNLTVDSADFARTVYRSVQDIRAAIRYFRANAVKLGVDPQKIFVMGNSAGGVLSLENIYGLSEDMFPSYIDKDPKLGGLDAYGIAGDNSIANAAVSLWGAVHSVEMIGSTSVPVLLIHGTEDATVPFKSGRPLMNYAEDIESIVPSMYASLTDGWTLNLNTPTLYGSFVVDSVLKAKGIEHETYFVEGEDHEFYNSYAYMDIVREKIFNFLYAQTQNKTPNAVKPIVLARASALHMGENNMTFTLDRGENVAYKVFDLRGKAQMAGSVSAGQIVDLSSLGNGVYILKVQGERPNRFGLRH